MWIIFPLRLFLLLTFRWYVSTSLQVVRHWELLSDSQEIGIGIRHFRDEQTCTDLGIVIRHPRDEGPNV